MCIAGNPNGFPCTGANATFSCCWDGIVGAGSCCSAVGTGNTLIDVAMTTVTQKE